MAGYKKITPINPMTDRLFIVERTFENENFPTQVTLRISAMVALREDFYHDLFNLLEKHIK